jgi:hypothetical protein
MTGTASLSANQPPTRRKKHTDPKTPNVAYADLAPPKNDLDDLAEIADVTDLRIYTYVPRSQVAIDYPEWVRFFKEWSRFDVGTSRKIPRTHKLTLDPNNRIRIMAKFHRLALINGKLAGRDYGARISYQQECMVIITRFA